ncbi:hypothetical protein E1A91_D10G153800v1 [Gossypium mustelinum]|uniref:Uncharacterized protein n=3 Tax=Gossypium TaxID=3633 RepID=A0A5J5PV86_GOSBA|nr:hypothetical protein ES319_D10G150000v1 [Gossypium barbadense]PPD73990.1 hypothetical protein GOBAR_DD29086 [Gossypium barbadense]TYH49830.1 hypothetical protein ES332_D10G162400v1 [Gossypium tomentosum]TYI61167.1 hypothetical protein E1A91_D10G153800v1 [Gossypium mustelinum]
MGKSSGRKSWSFSAMEMDVAGQFMQLCQHYISSSTAEQRRQTNPGPGCLNKDRPPPLMEELEEEEEHLQPKKRRFKSIDFIYSSTKPLILKKMKV